MDDPPDAETLHRRRPASADPDEDELAQRWSLTPADLAVAAECRGDDHRRRFAVQLCWLRAHGHVSESQFAAGERLRADWERAQLGPRVTMNWDAPTIDRRARGAPPAYDPGTSGLAAKARFDAAVDAVGPGLSDVLWRVVCAGEGMREAEGALGWPARAGKLVLGLALDRLAAFYRIG